MTSTDPQINLFDPGFLADPYPVYARLRSHDPFHRSFMGATVVSRYGDVTAVLRDPRFSSDVRKWAGFESRLGRDPSLSWLLCHWMPGQDPPAHTRVRRLFHRALASAEGASDAAVARLADEVIGEARERGSMEVVGELASRVPAESICTLFGIPEADRPQIRRWSRRVSTLLEPVPPLASLELTAEAIDGLAAYVGELWARRRARCRSEPGTDVLSRVAELVPPDEDEELILASSVFFLSAGHETTINLIGNGVLTLLRRPDQLERLRRQPDLLASAVEEMARFESPVQTIWRMATEDVDLGGRRIAAGEQVMLLLGSANRDGEQFEDADAFDVGRSPNRHLGYGYGRHLCQGVSLARTATRIAIGRLLHQAPHLRLKEGEPRWAPALGLRGLESLEVAL